MCIYKEKLQKRDIYIYVYIVQSLFVIVELWHWWCHLYIYIYVRVSMCFLFSLRFCCFSRFQLYSFLKMYKMLPCSNDMFLLKYVYIGFTMFFDVQVDSKKKWFCCLNSTWFKICILILTCIVFAKCCYDGVPNIMLLSSSSVP